MTPYEKLRMCGTKRGFATEANANATPGRKGIRLYRCPLCHLFHWTHQEFYKSAASNTGHPPADVVQSKKGK